MSEFTKGEWELEEVKMKTITNIEDVEQIILGLGDNNQVISLGLLDDDLAQIQKELSLKQATLGWEKTRLGSEQAAIGRKQIELCIIQAERTRKRRAQEREAAKNMKNSNSEEGEGTCETCAWAEVDYGPFYERDEDNDVIIHTGFQTTCQCPYLKSMNVTDDGIHRTLDEISKDMEKLLRGAYEAGKGETRVISKQALCKWLRNNREKIEKMLNEDE